MANSEQCEILLAAVLLVKFLQNSLNGKSFESKENTFHVSAFNWILLNLNNMICIDYGPQVCLIFIFN